MKRLVAVLGTIFVFFLILRATEIKSDQHEPESEFVVIGIEEAKAFLEDDENVAAVAGRLSQMGFRNVFIMKGSFEKWYQAGYDTEPDLSFRADERSIVYFFMPGCQTVSYTHLRAHET